MKRYVTAVAVIMGAVTACMLLRPPQVEAQQATPIVDPQADALLRQMSQLLAAAKMFTLTASSLTDEVTPTGQKIQYSKRTNMSIRRPDGVHSVTKGDKENFTAVYDGKMFALFNPVGNEYAVVPMPATIDAAVDMLATKYGLVAPLADVLFSDPYEAFSANLQAGVYLGEHDVNGVACHHIACRTAGADWQIWIETGQRPLPRKLLITYKTIPGEPQFIAFLDNWNLSATLAPEVFRFTPPAGAKRVELSPVDGPTTAPAR